MLNVSSGYDSMASNWKAFLQAWRDAPKEYPNTSLAISVNHDNCESGAQIELLRQRLRLEKLPTSYVDFLRSARVDERRQSHKGDNGLYSLEDVNYLSEVDKDYCRILEEQRIVGADPDYFMYGIEQRSWVSITEFLEGLIVIGKMFPNDYLLMNTKVQTKDGEFECILEGGDFRFRTLSFATMMRSWCVYECNNEPYYPPYPESMFNSGPSSFIKSGV